MKLLVKILISLFYKCYSKFIGFSFQISQHEIHFPNIFYKAFLSIKGTANKFKVTGACEKSIFSITGSNNTIEGVKVVITNSSIVISGNNNSISFGEGVILRKGELIIRGNNCCIIIHENSTFGEVRIINVGTNNPIVIGRNCLFGDNIEIWASDTHSIYDEEGNFINPEKPITIGNHVWVGSYVKILKGVDIGDNAVIGMNSMVTKPILPATLNAGNPLRVLKSNINWSLSYNEN
jgi:acetyltransferase-like isoleucine patch superfamily enzyme